VTVRGVISRPAEALRARAIGELAVLVRFRELVVALAAERVARIALTDEVAWVDGATPCVQIDGAVLPAWELAALIGLDEPPAAWLVLNTSDEPGASRIALGTGPCLAVAAHDALSMLPAGVINAPSAAVLGVFLTDPALHERGLGRLGIRIDPLRLIGASALAAARRGER
jgi:hypothetical protein